MMTFKFRKRTFGSVLLLFVLVANVVITVWDLGLREEWNLGSWYGYRAERIGEIVKPECRHEFSITFNKNESADADAIIFSFLAIHRQHGIELPPNRNRDVPWILALEESSIQHPNEDLKRYDGLFNWTWSYRSDSLIHPNFTEMFDEYEEPDGRWMVGTDFANEFLKNKTKVAAWVVSNCNVVQSKRNELVASLAKLGVEIEKYGKCSGRSCDHQPGGEECFSSLGATHKFYLAFENSLCEDYITEKIYHGLLHGMIPVVYALGNVGLRAPPNSFINVLDFPTVSGLADRILYLDQNHGEYLKYFEWRQWYDINVTGSYSYQCHHWRKIKEFTLKLRGDDEGEAAKYRHNYADLAQWYMKFYNEKLGKMCPACLSKNDIDVSHLSANRNKMYNNANGCV